MIFIGSLPLYFNSRPSARGDPVNVERKSFTPSHFNSRPSARGDVRVLVAAIIGAISIHAPPRGATVNARHVADGVVISIHAPPRGATDSGAEFRSAHHISIHAPPRGATTHPRHDCRHVVNFNSRPSARGDAGGSGWPPAGSAISIHAPPRGATVHRRSSRKPSGDFNSRPSARGDKCINHTVSVEHISIHAPPRGATHRVEAINY